MKKANTHQIKLFKEQYCYSDLTRKKIINDFSVDIETYEELLPGNTVKSYASGNRKIDKGFIVFRVFDPINDLLYYPVFSESLGRKLAKTWGIELPSKMTVFVADVNNSDGESKRRNGIPTRNEDNKKMLQLIQFARSMMILHVTEPEPMSGPFKSIYSKLETHPNFNVFASDVKSINTAISNYLKGSTNTNNENFTNLQQYINYLQVRYPNSKLRNFDFELLRNKIAIEYPDSIIVF